MKKCYLDDEKLSHCPNCTGFLKSESISHSTIPFIASFSSYHSQPIKDSSLSTVILKSRNFIEKPSFKQPAEEDFMNEIDEKEVKEVITEEGLEDESSDEDKWFPRFRNCDCCKGFIYNCKGETCTNMRYCYCKMKVACESYLKYSGSKYQ